MGRCFSVTASQYKLKAQPRTDKYCSTESDFVVDISNVSLLNCPRDSNITLLFTLLTHNFVYPAKSADQQAKYGQPSSFYWHKSHQARIFINEAALQKQKLTIAAQSLEKTFIPKISIDLRLILDGPIHHNLRVSLPGYEDCRLVFDFKISQMVELSIQIAKAAIELKNKHPGEEFHFSCKVITDNTPLLHSHPSYSVSTPLNTFSANSVSVSLDECASLLGSHEHQKVVWEKMLTDSSQKCFMPSFEVETNVSQLSNHHIQFVLWSTVADKAMLMADGFIPFWKIMEKNFVQKERIGTHKIETEERVVQLTTPLVLHEKTVGNVTLTIRACNRTYYKQNRYLARTETGDFSILSVNQPFLKLTESISSNLKLLNSLSNTLDTLMQQPRGNSEKKLLKIHQEVTSLNSKLSSPSIFSFQTQEKVEKLVANQGSMLKILQKLATYVSIQENLGLAERFWQLSLTILMRPQFGLGYLIISKTDILHDSRFQISVKFRDILSSLLILALQRGRYTFMTSTDNHLQKFKAFCFYRIPEFNSAVLNVIYKHSDSINNMLKEMRQNEPKQTSSRKQSWQAFFSYVDSHKSPPLKQRLERAFRNSVWFQQLERKEDIFHGFINLACRDSLKNNQQTYSSGRWGEEPEENLLLLSFLLEMSERAATKYSVPMIETALSLIETKGIANIYLRLLCGRTSLHDRQSTGEALIIIEEYLRILTKDGTTAVYAGFDSQYFFKMLQIIIEGEHYLLRSRALVLIFKYYNNFSASFKSTITFYLLGKVFFQLFFNWSPDVRNAFSHILLCRIAHANSASPENQVTKRYAKVMSIVKVAVEMRKREIRKLSRHSQDCLYERMRKKCTDKILNKPTQIKENPYSLTNLFSLVEQNLAELKLIEQKSSQQLRERLQLVPKTSELVSGTTLRSARKRSANFDTPYEEDQLGCFNPETGLRPRKLSITVPNGRTVRNRKYTVVDLTYELYTLTEITVEQKKVIMLAYEQYCELDESINKWIFMNGKLPTEMLVLKAMASE